MKVLVVGGGGREHAICWALKKSPKVTELFCAPGNAGISAIATCVPIGATDLDAMVQWAKENAMDLVMVAPDDPLALGMVDLWPPQERRHHRGQQSLFQGADGQVPHPHCKVQDLHR